MVTAYDDFQASTWSANVEPFDSPDGKWRVIYKSQGTAKVVTDASGNHFLQTTPPLANNPDNAGAAVLVQSLQQYNNIHIKFSVRLDQQGTNTTRGWYTFWPMVFVNDNTHYYFSMYGCGFGNGWEFGKKDNDHILGDDVQLDASHHTQQILASGGSPCANPVTKGGSWYTVEWWCVRDNATNNIRNMIKVGSGKNIDLSAVTPVYNSLDTGWYARGCSTSNYTSCTYQFAPGASSYFMDKPKSFSCYNEASQVSWDDIYLAPCIVAGEVFPTSNDILKTGNAVYDKYDEAIMYECTKFGWPDPMLMKAELVQESDMNQYETTLGTSWAQVCGIPSGWTVDEAQSLGLFQITPACCIDGSCDEVAMGVYTTTTTGKPLKHPIMTTDKNSSGVVITDDTLNVKSPYWSFGDSTVPGFRNGSLYHGNFNIHFALYIMSKHYAYFKAQFPTCPPNQWMLMCQAAYSMGRQTVTGCSTWGTQAQTYITNILANYTTLCQQAGYTPLTYVNAGGSGGGDTTLPTVTISQPANNNIVSTKTPIIRGTAGDNVALSRVEVQIDAGAWVAATGTTTWQYTTPILADGSHTANARAIDTSNNTSTVFTVTFKVDSIAPAITITQPQNQATLTGPASGVTFSVTGTASDATSGVALVEVQVDTGAWLAASGTTSWSRSVTITTGGSHTITARATDGAVNTALVTMRLTQSNSFMVSV